MTTISVSSTPAPAMMMKVRPEFAVMLDDGEPVVAAVVALNGVVVATVRPSTTAASATADARSGMGAVRTGFGRRAFLFQAKQRLTAST